MFKKSLLAATVLPFTIAPALAQTTTPITIRAVQRPACRTI